MIEPPTKPYGFVLILRGLAEAAIMLSQYPAALRVLCVMAEYMNQKGECRISMETIAARLAISRPAVSKHVAQLAGRELIYVDAAPGKTPRFTINLEGLDAERSNIEAVKDRRAERSHRRRGHVYADEREEGVDYEMIEEDKAIPDLSWYRRVATSEVTGRKPKRVDEPETPEVTTPVTSGVTPPETSEVTTPVTSEVSRRELLRDLDRGPLKIGAAGAVADAPDAAASGNVVRLPAIRLADEVRRMVDQIQTTSEEEMRIHWSRTITFMKRQLVAKGMSTDDVTDEVRRFTRSVQDEIHERSTRNGDPS